MEFMNLGCPLGRWITRIIPKIDNSEACKFPEKKMV